MDCDGYIVIVIERWMDGCIRWMDRMANRWIDGCTLLIPNWQIPLLHLLITSNTQYKLYYNNCNSLVNGTKEQEQVEPCSLLVILIWFCFRVDGNFVAIASQLCCIFPSCGCVRLEPVRKLHISPSRRQI